MTHWQDQFQQSQQGGLFLPQSPHMQRKQLSSPPVCPLCHQPHRSEDQSNDHRPPDDAEVWKQYWANKSQSWRTTPEISWCRQYKLSQRRLIQPEPKKGVYSFGKIPLNRADVEWLLATHENGRGPVDWNDENQRDREGLDLRGAHLEGEDLQGLPFAKLRGGLIFDVGIDVSEDERRKAGMCLIHANLSYAQLEGAKIEAVQLTGVNLTNYQGIGPSVADVCHHLVGYCDAWRRGSRPPEEEAWK